MMSKITVETFAAKLEALAELVRAGELETLRDDKPYLADAFVESVDDVLNWHRANEDAVLIWCGTCEKLRGREHICK